jgi:4-aminobutyrate aminotransferase-like enzyme
VLDILASERLVERCAAMGDVLEELLADALGGHAHVSDLRGRGLFRGIELRVDRDIVVRECLARDVWIYPAGSGPVPNAVMIGCPFTITEPELETIVETLRHAVDAAAAAS